MTLTTKTTVGIRTSFFNLTVLFLTEVLDLEIVHHDTDKEIAQLIMPQGQTIEVFGTNYLWQPFTTPPDWEIILADIRAA